MSYLLHQSNYNKVIINYDKVIKVINIDKYNLIYSIRELAIIKYLNQLLHPNIVNLINFDFTINNINLNMPIAMCDVASIINSKLTPALRYNFCWQTIMAVKYLHINNIIHGDIKPHNILVYYINNNYQLKLTDFGHSKSVFNNDNTLTYTYNYRPPEILTNLTYDQSADIWALGCTLIQILTTVVAFHPRDITFEDSKVNQQKLLILIYKLLGKPKSKLLIEASQQFLNIKLDSIKTVSYKTNLSNIFAINDTLTNLIKQMLQIDPIDRLKLQSIVYLPTAMIPACPLWPNKIDSNIISLIGKMVAKYKTGFNVYWLTLALLSFTNNFSGDNANNCFYLVARYVDSSFIMLNKNIYLNDTILNYITILIYPTPLDLLIDYPNQDQAIKLLVNYTILNVTTTKTVNELVQMVLNG